MQGLSGYNAPHKVAGRSLAHLLSGASPIERAFYGADLRSGHLALVEPTLKQAAQLTGSNTTYIVAAEKISPPEREIILANLRPLIPVKAPVPVPSVPATPPTIPVVMDLRQKLAEIVAVIGVDEVLEILTEDERVAA
jgi:hypothetical protein